MASAMVTMALSAIGSSMRPRRFLVQDAGQQAVEIVGRAAPTKMRIAIRSASGRSNTTNEIATQGAARTRMTLSRLEMVQFMPLAK